MYELSEAEMCERCVLGGCRHFNACEKASPSQVEAVPVSVLIPMEPARDVEYTGRW